MSKIVTQNFGIHGNEAFDSLMIPFCSPVLSANLIPGFYFLQHLSYKLSGKTEWTYPLGIAEKENDLGVDPALPDVSGNKQSSTSRKQRLVNTIINL